MRALIFDGNSVRLDSSYTNPTATDGFAIIRLVKAAVSSSDLSVFNGSIGFRGVLGHQFVGKVESVTEKKYASLVGKRVIGSIIISCGHCNMCLAGLSAHCRERKILGMHEHDGCLSDRFTLPARNLQPIPDVLDDDHGVFAYEVAAAILPTQQLSIGGKPHITVLGDNSLGLLVAQVLGQLNASVRLVGNHSETLALCEKWGMKHRHIDDIGRRADQDIVVECTGTRTGLQLAMKLVRPRGKIVLKSLNIHQQQPEQYVDLTSLVLNEIEVIGSYAGPMREAVAMLAGGEIDIVSLISKRMTLADGSAIFKAAEQPNVIKVVVDP